MLETSSETRQSSASNGAVWHVPLRDLATALATDAERGLSDEDARKRLELHGRNKLAEAEPPPLWRRFIRHFTDLVVVILLVAAVIAGAIGEWIDTIAILAIVVLNAALGFFQEERAGRALAALKSLSSPVAKVWRDGRLRSMPAADIVTGDRIELEAGDSVPADCRIDRAVALRTQEATLTGESAPVGKEQVDTLPPDTPLAERRNMLFMGTIVAAGKCSAIVTATGMRTELGNIAGLLEGTGSEPTPLQRRLAELGKILVAVCLFAVTVVFTLQLVRGNPLLESLIIAVSLAVAAVPEGLPAVVTMALSLGLQRMVARQALVRTLPSVETLGSVTVICSDKTGTLTRNEMTVREVVVGTVRYRVSGGGYEAEGELEPLGIPEGSPERDAESHGRVVARLVEAGAWCNDAHLSQRADGSWSVTGDPTEAALVVLARKARVEVAERERRRIGEIPFDSERKAMSVVVDHPSNGYVMFTKGAPEVVLEKCATEWIDGEEVPLSDRRRAEIAAANREMAHRALRVLAFASRSMSADEVPPYEESNLVFEGLAGLIDPPREEVRAAVNRCRSAGIRPVMITGDHPATAAAIAAELAISGPQEGVVSGRELDMMDDRALRESVQRSAVYARVSAEHKLRIVKALKANGDVVAMTGDGVNDAPAVRAADIGIAMGRTGTDVTKEASDMVLLDDNFATIVNAVEEGRGIFDNIRKFIVFLLTCNTSEILFMLFASAVGWPIPLTAVQLLWINLVTDSLPALALTMEPPEPDIMKRPPRRQSARVITRQSGAIIVIHGLIIAAVTAIAFAVVLDRGGIDRARTVALSTMAYSQLCFAFASRSHTRTMPELGFASNPYLFGAIALAGLLQLGVIAMPFAHPIFETNAQSPFEWALVLFLALVPVTLVEVTKLVRAWRKRSAR